MLSFTSDIWKQKQENGNETNLISPRHNNARRVLRVNLQHHRHGGRRVESSIQPTISTSEDDVLQVHLGELLQRRLHVLSDARP